MTPEKSIKPAERAEKLPDLPELPDLSSEAGQDAETDVSSKMQGLENKHKRMLNFKPIDSLSMGAVRMWGEIKQLKDKKADMKEGSRGRHDVLVGTPDEMEEQRKQRKENDTDSINKNIEDLMADIALREAAVKNLAETGKDKWASEHFDNLERQAAEKLKEAAAKENALREQKSAGDVAQIELRAKELKDTQVDLLRAQRKFEMITDQRAYLDLMGKKGAV